ncbi:MAG TPA: hypothetical protein VJN92_17425 [Candidatus Acidoferrum sp.]|nr:hypothetical protein [Candidatus Acidoferrum sp.]
MNLRNFGARETLCGSASSPEREGPAHQSQFPVDCRLSRPVALALLHVLGNLRRPYSQSPHASEVVSQVDVPAALSSHLILAVDPVILQKIIVQLTPSALAHLFLSRPAFVNLS